ncbi:hypothetical protein NDU88_006850 [Pleurodeles waltl]|uniref:Uncharacterized protein n=1 Tax=Pleurodeles waltl TaxID=8319 RepID=A0AAV7MEM5_PLEWA|nr:hypothetical protein NDU88_006850 [Pleurodeles waltl]
MTPAARVGPTPSSVSLTTLRRDFILHKARALQNIQVNNAKVIQDWQSVWQTAVAIGEPMQTSELEERAEDAGSEDESLSEVRSEAGTVTPPDVTPQTADEVA